MADEQGSLRYTIDLESQEAIRGLREFRRSLGASRVEWRAFRDEVRGTRADTRGIGRDLRRLADETTRAANAARLQAQTNEQRRRSQRSARQETQRDTQAQRQNAEARRQTALAGAELERARLNSRRQILRLTRQSVQVARTEAGVLTQQVRSAERLAIAKRQAGQSRDIRTGEIASARAERELLEAQNDLEREQSRLGDQQLQQARAQLALTRQQLRLEQQRNVSAANRAAGRLSTGQSVEQVAFDQLQRDLDGLNIEEAKNRLRELNPEFERLRRNTDQAGDGARRAGGRFDFLNRILGSTEGRANRIAFTFRRLIGIFAAFTIIRRVTQLFTSAIRGALQFNAALEQSRLGIASLFTAVGEVRTATGEAASASRQLALAQEESRRQVNLLRRDAILTVATFQELRDAFQVAVAPGVTAGLNIDQIREFSVRISQAAGAIGLAGNQLSEEIRSILSGTIQQRTTRIAAALGITNEDIRRAREAGVLFEFLQDRFRAFEEAGREALNTFSGVVSNLRDAFELLLQQGSEDFFLLLKDLLQDVLGTIAQFDGNEVVINPEVLSVVEGVFEGLERAVNEARRLGEAIDLSTLQAAGDALGSFIGTSAEILGAAIEGFIQGIRDISAELQPLNNLLGNVLDPGDVQQSVTQVSRLLTIVLAISVAWSGVLSVVSLILRPITRIGAFVGQIATQLGGWRAIGARILQLFARLRSVFALLLSPIGLIVSGFVLVGLELNRISEDVFGISLRFGTLAEIVRTTLVNAFKFAASVLRANFLSVINSIKIAFDSVIQLFREGLFLAVQGALTAADLLPFVDFTEQLDRLRASREEARQEYVDGLEEDAKEIAAAWEEVRATTVDAIGSITEDIKRAFEENEDAETLGEFAERIQSQIADAFSFDESNPFSDAEEGAKGLVEQIRELPGILTSAESGVQGLEDTFRQLEQDLRQANAEIELNVATQGLEGVTGDLRTELTRGRIRLSEEELELQRAIEAQELAIAAAQQEVLRLQQETNRVYSDNAGAVDELVRLSQRLAEINERDVAAQGRLRTLETLRDRLATEGQQGRADEIQREVRAQMELVEELREAAEFGEGAVQSILERIGAVGDQELVDLVKERVLALGTEAVRRQELVSLSELQGQLEAEIARIAIARAVGQAERQRSQSQERLAQLQAELNAERRLTEFTSILRENAPERGLVEAQGALDIEQSRLRLLQDRLAAQNAANQATNLELEQLERAIQRENERKLAKVQAAGATPAQLESLRNQQLDEALQRETRVRAIKDVQILQQQELNNEIGLQGEAIRRAVIAFEEQTSALEEPVTFGLQTAFSQFINESDSQFERWRALGTEAVEGFGQTVSGILSDAFDPRRAVDVEAAFGEFFLRIGSQLANNLIDQGVASILRQFAEESTAAAQAASLTTPAEALDASSLNLQAAASALQAPSTTLSTGASSLGTASASLGPAATSLASGAAALASNTAFASSSLALSTGASTLAGAIPGLQAAAGTLLLAARALSGAAFGAVEGGPIPRFAFPSPAHSLPGVPSLAGGGRVPGLHQRAARPSGVDPRDTVPLWGQAGEFMHPVRAVRAYGSDVMEAIRRVAIDPVALRALAGIGSSFSVRTPSKPSFQEGGLVSDTLQRANSLASRASAASESRGLFQRALIVPDEETMERLLAAGAQAQRQWLQENAAEARISLGG